MLVLIDFFIGYFGEEEVGRGGRHLMLCIVCMYVIDHVRFEADTVRLTEWS